MGRLLTTPQRDTCHTQLASCSAHTALGPTLPCPALHPATAVTAAHVDHTRAPTEPVQ